MAPFIRLLKFSDNARPFQSTHPTSFPSKLETRPKPPTFHHNHHPQLQNMPASHPRPTNPAPPRRDPELSAFLLDVRFAWCDIITRGAERYAQRLRSQNRNPYEVYIWSRQAGRVFDAMISELSIRNPPRNERIDAAMGDIVEPYTRHVERKRNLWGHIVHGFVDNFTNGRSRNRRTLVWIRKVRPRLGWVDSAKTHEYLARLIDAMERP